MTTEVVERTGKPTPPVGRWDRYAAWSLLLVTALMYVGAVVVGERETDVSALREAIGAGDVSEVQISEDLVGIGYGTVTIRWREHGLHYATTVTQASDERQARQARRENDDAVVVVGDVADALTTNGREVTVTGPTRTYYGATWSSVLGFTVPGWFAFVGLGTICVTLLLIGSIEPWRATRWGWAWLVLLTPIGVPLFLILGGLTGLLRPRPGAYRLTGGWAFLLASAIGAALR